MLKPRLHQINIKCKQDRYESTSFCDIVWIEVRF